ncbi:MAG: hypothetical protein RL095_437 [Verrucomicrobiota bacterium]|jgi:hypothetical protein
MKFDHDHIFFIGDTHADLTRFKTLLRDIRLPRSGSILCIQVGDFGYLGYEERVTNDGRAGRLMTALEKYDIDLLFIDGNHEDFVWMKERYSLDIHAPRFQPVGPRLTYAGRGAEAEIRGQSVIFLGGAGSIDRPWRTPQVDWFPEEALDPELDLPRLVRTRPLDLLISHDSPLTEAVKAAHAVFAARAKVDVAAEAYTAECNQRYARVVEQLRPRQIVHGHQHQSYVEDWSGIRIFGLIHLQAQRHGQVLLSWDELLQGGWKSPESGEKS